MPILTGLSEALRAQTSALTSAVSGARRGEARGIHRARVATRRLREVLAIAGGPAGGEARRIGRELRRLARALGPVRELDVAREVLAEAAAEGAWPVAAVGRVDEYCALRRQEAFREAGDLLGPGAIRGLRARLVSLAGSLETAAPAAAVRVRSELTRRLHARARGLARAIDEAGVVYAPARLHTVRIAAKKLRYVLEASGRAWPAQAKALRTLQSSLGRLHDAQVLQHVIQSVASRTPDRPLVATLTSIDGSLESRCREWHAAILPVLPDVARTARSLVREAPRALAPRDLARPARLRSSATARSRPRVA